MYMYMYIYIYSCIYIHLYLYIHAHTHTNVSTFTHMRIQVYIEYRGHYFRRRPKPSKSGDALEENSCFFPPQNFTTMPNQDYPANLTYQHQGGT